ncbi:MAG: NAD-dependent epimerase/dehydratase family protein [Victivallaceae bacterium]
MKVFLTGASGFIGRNIIEGLSRQHTIFAPAHKELDLLDEDAVRAFMKQNPVDVVIHGAIKPAHRNAKDFSDILYSNTRMYFNLVRNSDCFGRMLYLGSGLCYDMRYYMPKMKEEYFDRHVPGDDAGFAKYICSKHCAASTKIVDLRVFGVFGKYEDYAIRFISNAICKTLFDLPVTLKQNRKFDYIYINDLVRIIELFMLNDIKAESYNITPDSAVSLLEIAEMIIDISGKHDLPILVMQEGMGMEYSGSNERFKQTFSEFTFTPIKQAISELYAFYAGSKDNLNRDVLLQDK